MVLLAASNDTLLLVLVAAGPPMAVQRTSTSAASLAFFRGAFFMACPFVHLTLPVSAIMAYESTKKRLFSGIFFISHFEGLGGILQLYGCAMDDAGTE